MNTTTTARVVELQPAPTEVALAHLAPGSVVRVQIGQHTREHQALLEGEPLTLTFAGEELGWGCRVCEYICLPVVRNGRHRLDRPVWQDAVKAVRGYGVVYLGFEQQPYFSKQRWTATGLRIEGQESGR